MLKLNLYFTRLWMNVKRKHICTYKNCGCNFSSQKVELILKVPCKLTFQRAEYCVTMITNNYVGKMQ